MIPTSIDGTDITGATIDGTDVTEITVDGDTVFTSVPPDLLAYWTFDNADTSGSTAIDTVGSNDGTINGATTGVTGANDTYTTAEAYDFDGSNDHVDLGGTVVPDVDGDYSVSLWFNSTSNSSSTMFGTRDTDNTNSVFQIDFKGDFSGRIDAREFRNATAIASSNAGFNDGTWHQVTVTRGGGTTSIYLDGSFEDSTSSEPIDFDDAFFIGGRGGSGGNDSFFPGSIDDVRIYSKTLSASEVSNLYNNGAI